jgi:hypothetical protein
MGSPKEGGGWRPGGGAGPVRRGPKADWMPTTEPPKRRTRRYLQLVLLLAFFGIVGAGIWLYYLLIPPSPPVLLIITTDPSADATDLQAPIDPYGWLSGQHLKKWTERYEADAPSEIRGHAPRTSNGSDVLKNNDTIKETKDLADWAVSEARHSGSFKKPSESAVIFFGLHTGADANGPFLYANKGRKFHVDELLQHLSEKMGSTKVLVMFDPARLPPDPARGQLNDGFVDAMKALNHKIAALKNITVLLGCDSGERGWESEELQRTAFAHAVIEGLGGKAEKSLDNYITAKDLHAYVKQATKDWTRRNRPTTQNPILLPAGEVGEQRAGETKLVLHHNVKDEPPPAPRDPLPSLQKKWDAYRALAGEKGIGPEVYTPRHWRRYRELLLRYELVARAGDDPSMGALDSALAKEASAIREALQARVINETRTASLPMWQASGQQPTATADSELRGPGSRFIAKPTAETLTEFREKLSALPNDRIAYTNDLLKTTLKPTADSHAARAQLLRAIWEGQPIRPPDAQLVLMLDQFFRQLVNEELPTETDAKGITLWQRAVAVRRLAEDAALGPPTEGHPYSEVVWRYVQPVIESGDASRRRAEDLLFAPVKSVPDRRGAFTDLDKAEEQYSRAAKRAVQLRDALTLRDAAYSDLPYLGRWSVFAGEERFRDKASKLWKAVHLLARQLDELPPEAADANPATDTKYGEMLVTFDEVRESRKSLADEYARAFEAESTKLEVKTQTTWRDRERLLAVPPLRMSVDAIAIRAKLVSANRATTNYLLSPANQTAPRPDDERERTFNKKDRAMALGFLGLNELGDDLVGRQAKVDNLTGWDTIRDEINKISEKTWVEAASAGDRLKAHYQNLEKAADPPATDSKAAEAERASRVALVAEHREGREPAERNRDYRWQRLFLGQAYRAVQDHYYDGERPYFRDLATAYLKESDALTPPDPTHAADKMSGHDPRTLLGFTESQYRDFDMLLKAEPLRLKATKLDVPWTTEPQKSVGYSLTAGAAPEGGRAVVWAAFDPKENPRQTTRFAGDAAARQVRDLQRGDVSLPVAIETPDVARAVRESLTVRRSAFFRGQFIKDDAPIVLNRMPDLIATHARAQSGDSPRVAFVGPNDLDVGVVSIVIDYSPSMTRPPRNNPNGEPRINRTWVELEKILTALPDGTELMFRGFGLVPLEGERVKALDFESAATKGGIDKDDKSQLKYPTTYDHTIFEKRIRVEWSRNAKQLQSVMQTLKTASVYKEKDGEQVPQSPVIRSLINAAREDFEGVPAEQTKVLIMLTDGADNSSWDYSNPNEPKLNFNPLMTALENEFKRGKGQNITLRMLLINDSDSDKLDIEHTKEFEKRAKTVLDSFDPPGSILVGEVRELGKELADLLRPRVRLVRDGKRLPDVPVRFTDPVFERPEWKQLDEIGRYDAWVGQKPKREDPQELQFSGADRLMLSLSRPDPKKPVQFERIVWGRYGRFGDELKNANRRLEDAGKNWLLSAVMYRGSIDGYLGEQVLEKGRRFLDLTVAVENMKNTTAQPLGQIAPEFAWFELNADKDVALGVKEAPIYLWREYSHPAPAWRLRRAGWTDAADNQLPPSTLRAWVEQRNGLLKSQQMTTITDLSVQSASGVQDDGKPWNDKWTSPDWTVSFGWEAHAFATNPDSNEPEKPRWCLVVRVYARDPNRLPKLNNRPAPYFVQVDNARIEEHRYFRDVGAYTGYFYLGPAPTPDSAINRKVKLFSAADLDKPNVSSTFELPLARAPSDGSDEVWKFWEQYSPKKP